MPAGEPGRTAGTVRADRPTGLGAWPVEGYEVKQSRTVHDGRFVGLALALALAQHLQHLLTDQRIGAWLDDLAARLLADLAPAGLDHA